MKASHFVASVVLFALAAFGAVNRAHGALLVEVRVDGGAWHVLSADPDDLNTVMGSLNDVDGTGVNVLGMWANSNSPGYAPGSELVEVTGRIVNTTSSAHTVDIRTGATDYTYPDISQSAGRVGLSSAIGGTFWNGTALTVSHQMWVDPSNGQSSQSGATITSANNQALTGGGGNTDFGFSKTDESQYVNATPFSVTTLTTLSVAANLRVNFSSSATVYAVPEPASAIAWGASGMFLLGMAALRRFKRSPVSGPKS